MIYRKKSWQHAVEQCIDAFCKSASRVENCIFLYTDKNCVERTILHQNKKPTSLETEHVSTFSFPLPSSSVVTFVILPWFRNFRGIFFRFLWFYALLGQIDQCLKQYTNVLVLLHFAQMKILSELLNALRNRDVDDVSIAPVSWACGWLVLAVIWTAKEENCDALSGHRSGASQTIIRCVCVFLCHRGHYKALSRCRLVGSCVLPGENFFT